MQLKEMVLIAKNNEASDIHLNVGAKPKIRKHGLLIDIEKSPKLTSQQIEEIANSILTKNNKEALTLNGDIDIAYQLESYRLRVNIFKELHGLAISIRILYSEIPTLESLSIPDTIKGWASLKRGLVLITGATGSGKSTTLAAIINHINMNRKEHIITIEDPIEYVYTHKNCIISQRELGRDTNSFENALRGSLRQDPDIILLGEMRDLKTMEVALTAAETGHLVFSTLHTNSATDTINRILDTFPYEAKEQIKAQLASTLKGVVTQLLIPKLDNTGRVLALEIMVVNQAIKNLIREGKTHQIDQVIHSNLNMGMQSMDMQLAKLYKEKVISFSEASLNCTNPSILRELIDG